MKHLILIILLLIHLLYIFCNIEGIKNGNIIEILPLFLQYCKKYGGDEDEALLPILNASSPLSKNLVFLNQKALEFFIGLAKVPMPFGFLIFYFVKFINY